MCVLVLDRLGRRNVGESRRLRAEARALRRDLQARLRDGVIEAIEAERVEDRDEGGVGIARQRVAQRQRAMGRQLGDETVGQRLDTIFLLGRTEERRVGKEWVSTGST